MSHLFDELVQCDARARLLRLLFLEERAGSVSELARRAGLSARAIGVEVTHLQRLGLAHVEALGATRRVSANLSHPAAEALVRLLAIPATEPVPDVEALRASLVRYGAPLISDGRPGALSLEAAILAGLEAGRRDGLLLRVLPVVLAKNLAQIDWNDLLDGARRAELKAELGWLLEATGLLLGEPGLAERSTELMDRRRSRMTYYPEARSRFERQLAEETSPEVARKWSFYMNLSEASLRAVLAKHMPEGRLA